MTESPASCSALSAEQPLLGTASVQMTYVVVDCPKPWSAKIQASASFPAKDALELAYASKLSFGLLGRVPGGSESSLTVYRYIYGLVTEASLRLDRPDLGQALVQALQTTVGFPAEQALLVCTHGSRDRCCGTLGVPLLKALRALEPSRKVVEVSHLGGHRFAPTSFAVPEWRTFGRVAPERAAGLLASLDVGDLGQLDWLRGQNALGPAAQVLEAAWAREEGRMPIASSPVPGDEQGVRCLFAGQGWRERRGALSQTSWTGPLSCVDIGTDAGRTEHSWVFKCWETPPIAVSPEQTAAPL